MLWDLKKSWKLLVWHVLVSTDLQYMICPETSEAVLSFCFASVYAENKHNSTYFKNLQLCKNHYFIFGWLSFASKSAGTQPFEFATRSSRAPTIRGGANAPTQRWWSWRGWWLGGSPLTKMSYVTGIQPAYPPLPIKLTISIAHICVKYLPF